MKTSPRLGETVSTMAVTFLYGELPPLTVWIPKDQDTEKGRASAIRAKIQEALSRQPKVMKV